DASKLTGLTPEQLQLKDGCAVIMRLETAGGRFAGGTVGSGCPSTLRGATYATSEVTLTQDTLLSWDRGYDAAGEQVWGAKKGGYVFVKQPSATPTPAPTKAR
ncbi:MAG: chromophore lyase CpcT/CpeT, partial [Phycisphaerales bacterium]|nr:chromophore lyase CpcT/CpeT [Phycisphaerales bacterium]